MRISDCGLISRRRVNSNVRCRPNLLVLLMADAAIHDRPTNSGGLITLARLITWITPVALWIIHIFVIVPRINSQSGEAQFITAIGFFIVAGPIMIIAFIVSVLVLIHGRSRRDLIPLLLNLSWLYYLKVIVYGPTIGNL